MPKKLYDDEEENDAVEEHEVGPCKNCQFFDVDREEQDATGDMLAACLHPDLEEYELVLSGDSGCNLYEPYEEDDEEEEEEEDDEEDDDEEY